MPRSLSSTGMHSGRTFVVVVVVLGGFVGKTSGFSGTGYSYPLLSLLVGAAWSAGMSLGS